MSKNELLNKELDCEDFMQYYFLKEELMDFCRENGLSAAGGKIEIKGRIYHYLKCGEKLEPVKKIRVNSKNEGEYYLEREIGENFGCTEKARAFFKSIIGDDFKFKVAFQNYLKNNPEKTLKDAVNYWFVQQHDKKETVILDSCEYNKYIRAFFKDNKDKTFKDAVKCWNYKRRQKGTNKYEKEDLSIL